MLGKTYAMEVVQEYVNHAETIMKYGELYFDD